MKNTLIAVAALSAGLLGGYALSLARIDSETPRAEERAMLNDAPLAHTSDMHAAMDSMTSGLAGKDGGDFEAAFIDEMIVHHEGAVAMARMVLEKTARPELVTLANDIIKAQTTEIEMMRRWKQEWFSDAARSPHE